MPRHSGVTSTASRFMILLEAAPDRGSQGYASASHGGFEGRWCVNQPINFTSYSSFDVKGLLIPQARSQSPRRMLESAN
jgi:hypothetical protein